MAGWDTSLEAAIDAIVSVCKASPGLNAAYVSDGPAVVDAATTQLVTIGHQANSTDDLAANVQTAPEGWGNGPQRENLEVYCSTSAFAGDDDQSVCRGLAINLYKAVCAAIHADPTLGKAVMRASPSSFVLHQAATTQGRVATVNFSIAVDAYTT